MPRKWLGAAFKNFDDEPFCGSSIFTASDFSIEVEKGQETPNQDERKTKTSRRKHFEHWTHVNDDDEKFVKQAEKNTSGLTCSLPVEVVTDQTKTGSFFHVTQIQQAPSSWTEVFTSHLEHHKKTNETLATVSYSN